MQIQTFQPISFEPLVVKFRFLDGGFDIEKVATFLRDWFANSQKVVTHEADIRYFNVEVVKDCATVAVEFVSLSLILKLAKELEAEFPTVVGLEIGDKDLHLPVACESKDNLPEFSSSLVSVGDFSDFLLSTQYVPTMDRDKGSMALVRDNQHMFGKSKRNPIYCVSHDDALAYCNWKNVRLPTEVELRKFLLRTLKNGIFHKWTGEVWTSTACCENSYVTVSGPFSSGLAELPSEKFRKCFKHDFYDDFHATVFFCVEDLEKQSSESGCAGIKPVLDRE
jgi:hypothetical protein